MGTMKIGLILRGYTVISFILIIFPFFLIFTNDYFSLPAYRNYICQIIGLLLVLTGISVILYCLKLFVRIEKGIPVPTEQPKQLVTQGLYKFTRNPMYLGAFLILFGEFLLFGRLLLFFYFLISIPAFHFNVIYREEPELKRRFGKKYIQYTEKVPRWL